MYKPNKQQQEAIEYTGGPLLIIAGPGTGKTFVITEKIKYLINNLGVNPESVLALTFTEKAAREMEDRVDQSLPYGYFQMSISTFHSFADKVLKDEAYNIGLPMDYKLITDPEAIIFFRKHLFEFPLEYFRPLGNPSKFISAIIKYFSRLKDENITADDYINWVKNKSDWQTDEEFKKHKELSSTYKIYQQLKIDNGFMDFSDLLLYLLELFKTRKNILNKYKSLYRYILIDEFQDTNLIQYELIKLLAPNSDKPNLTVVGDDSQAIYKFRGASVSNILSFKQDYPDCKMITLIENYRSDQSILNLSYDLIQNNNPDTLEYRLKISKKLTANQSFSGSQIDLFVFDNEQLEAEKVVEKIESLVKQHKLKYSDFAILARANNQLEPFIRVLVSKGIPYQLSGSLKLFRRPEIKELIAYLNFISNPSDSVSLYRVLRMSVFDIDPIDLKLLLDFSKKINYSFYVALKLYLSYFVSEIQSEFNKESYKKYLPKIREQSIRQLVKAVKIFDKHLQAPETENAGFLLYDFLEKTGYLKTLNRVKSEYDEEKLLNVSRFFSYLKELETKNKELTVLQAVEYVNMCLQMGDSPSAVQDNFLIENNAVNLMTVHSAKGLEFNTVFVVSLVKERFPSRNQSDPIEVPIELIKEILPEGDFHIQEERRLFYVALTRAKERLFLTAAKYYAEGKRLKKLSPFLYEIFDEEFINRRYSQSESTDSQLFLFSFNSESGKDSQFSSILNKKYSYSQLESFKTCPLQYKYMYVLRLPSAPNSALAFGESIHKVLYKFYLMYKNNKNVNLDTLYDLLDQEWVPVGYASKNHEKRAYEEAKTVLKKFFDQLHSPELDIIALEKSFNFKIQDKIITGKIDRVDRIGDKIQIIDYKTGKKPNDRMLKKSLQLSIYALAACQKHTFNKDVDKIELAFYYLSDSDKVVFQKTKEEIESASDEILRTIEEIENSDFKPNVGRHCDFCPFRTICPAWQ
ncbi:MAG: DNA helicase [Patescibacteria group bacterium]|nr:MAG: DNA helicase [Patescibacteria group bacterium]